MTIDLHKISPRFKRIFSNPIILSIALVIPIIIFMLPMLMTGNKITPGDPDYIFHLAEAGRKTILTYHQFPMWDPWLSGGIPLFGSIVYGLVSLQTPFTLLFGTVVGWKLAIVAYQIVGFFGFKKLFQQSFKTDELTGILLAYIPVLGSFFIYRAVGGHSPFLLLAFFPWLLHFFLQRRRQRSWLWFGLVLSGMIWTSPHYITIMSLLVIGIWYIYEFLSDIAKSLRTKESLELKLYKSDLLFVAKTAGLTLLLCFYRMFYVTTFIRDFPRPGIIDNDHYTGVIKGLQAIWGPNPYSHPLSLPSGYGWVEATSYIGLGSIVALGLVATAWYLSKRKPNRKKNTPSLFSYSPIILILLYITFFTLGMGDFGQFSPYVILHNLPIFGSMRVASRWLMWSSLFALFIIACYRGIRFRVAINLALLAVIVEFFIITWGPLTNSFSTQIQHYRQPDAPFDQTYHYNVPRPLYAKDKNFQKVYFYDENLYETTVNNYGQVIAGDPLVDTRQAGSTIRCGRPEGNCNFISPNAEVVYWSPNKIELMRKAPGWIQINMNPGRGWTVNGVYAFAGDKITEPTQPFIIKDPSRNITLEYLPMFSPMWILHKL